METVLERAVFSVKPQAACELAFEDLPLQHALAFRQRLRALPVNSRRFHEYASIAPSFDASPCGGAAKRSHRRLDLTLRAQKVALGDKADENRAQLAQLLRAGVCS
jgi:hypothetical protein